MRDLLNAPVRDDSGYWQALGTLELGCRVMYAWAIRGFKG
jgi:hypothetical protein